MAFQVMDMHLPVQSMGLKTFGEVSFDNQVTIRWCNMRKAQAAMHLTCVQRWTRKVELFSLMDIR